MTMLNERSSKQALWHELVTVRSNLALAEHRIKTADEDHQEWRRMYKTYKESTEAVQAAYKKENEWLRDRLKRHEANIFDNEAALTEMTDR